MATKKTTFKGTKVPGVRRNSRTGMYEALVTKFLGSFETLEQAGRARERFLAVISKVSPKRNGLSTAERKRDEVEARKIVAGHLKSAASRATATQTNQLTTNVSSLKRREHP